MPIQFRCPQCKKVVKTADSSAGKKGRCPHCQAIFDIPAKSAGPVSAPASSASKAQGIVEFNCPNCTHVVRTPAAHAGKKGKCPSCESVVTIPLKSNVSRPKAAQPEGGLQPLDDDPLGATDFGPSPQDDLLGGLSDADMSGGYGQAAQMPGAMPAPAFSHPQGNPYASTYSGGYTAPARSGWTVQGKVAAPAITLIVVWSLSLVVMLGYGIVVALGVASMLGMMQQVGDSSAQANLIGRMVGFVLGYIISLVIHGIAITGAVKMLKFQSYGLAITASIVSMLPCSACWVTLPFGIWSIIVLCMSDVKQAFR